MSSMLPDPQSKPSIGSRLWVLIPLALIGPLIIGILVQLLVGGDLRETDAYTAGIMFLYPLALMALVACPEIAARRAPHDRVSDRGRSSGVLVARHVRRFHRSVIAEEAAYHSGGPNRGIRSNPSPRTRGNAWYPLSLRSWAYDPSTLRLPGGFGI